jgi:glycine betaine transporter
MVALPLCFGVGLLGILKPDALADGASSITGAAFRALDWFFLAEASAFLLLCLWLAFGRYGHFKLGQPDEEPEFSDAAWLSMLFAAGMGVGLLFWGVAEPMIHFTAPPEGVARSAAAARHAMVLTNFHWGLHAWAIYGVAGLVLAWFAFRKKTPYLPGAPLRAVFKGRWVDPTARFADLVAVLAIAFGVAGSIAMGVMQLHTGLSVVDVAPAGSMTVQVIILGVLFVSYMASATTSLDKGIKILSQLNMSIALLLLAFVLVAGPTASLMGGFVTTIGDYLSALPSLMLNTYPHTEQSGWLHGWTVTYLIWWIAWAPFVGIFIARISRGRTVREFIIGVVGGPTVFSMLWFAVFGGTGLTEELSGGGGIAQVVNENVTVALFTLFERLPLSDILNVTSLALVFVFLVTSVDSATYVLGMLTSRGAMEPPTRRKIGWGITLAVLGGALMISGRIDVVRAVSVVGAIPFAFILVLQVGALLRSMREAHAQEAHAQEEADQ